MSERSATLAQSDLMVARPVLNTATLCVPSRQYLHTLST